MRAPVLFLLLAGLIAALSPMAPAEAKPDRIVSLNVCSDQLLLLLAKPEQIASVSFLARDPAYSAMTAAAAAHPVNHGHAEEVLPLDPDLVLTGEYTARTAAFLLQELGYRVEEVPQAADLAGIRAGILRVAALVGDPAAGERLVADFDARLAALAAPTAGRKPLAALFWANSYTSGRGSLANALVEAAGFRTLGAAMGLSGTAPLPLEALLAARPDMLILGYAEGPPALASEVLRHPALQSAFAGRPTVSIPNALWSCGTPHAADAIALLAAAREAVQ